MLGSNRSRAVVVVPARYASTRFPAKMLAPLEGKPLVMHAYDRARKARLADDVLIATDDARIADAVARYDAHVVMTRPDHPSGTDRIAEAVADMSAELVVNVQGDEALLEPSLIDAVIEMLDNTPDAVMATARHPISDPARVQDPNTVKVVCDGQGAALYFSRCPIPYIRDTEACLDTAGCYWQHIGLYAYRKDFLMRFAALPQTLLEKLEKLEQLRALEHGYKIMVVDTDYEGIGVDVPDDLETVRQMMSLRREKQDV